MEARPLLSKERTMLLRIGNVEAEVKVAAVMSTPRLGFTDNLFCVSQALAPHRISPIKVTGAFWGVCLSKAMEQVIDTHDVILTFDYDTVFTAKTVEALLALMMHSGVDAIAPLQSKREANAVMFSPLGYKPEEKLDVGNEWFEKPVQLVRTAHFGATFLRTSALKKLKKPWFIRKVEEDGSEVDEDIAFWHAWEAAGNTLGMATHVSVGHAELMVTWPSRTVEGGKVHQHTTDFWNNKDTPPKDVWGFVA
jgi:hypothetical protein